MYLFQLCPLQFNKSSFETVEYNDYFVIQLMNIKLKLLLGIGDLGDLRQKVGITIKTGIVHVVFLLSQLYLNFDK